MSDASGKRPLFDWTINLSHIGAAIAVLVTVGTIVLSLRDEMRQTGVELRSLVEQLRAENKMQDQVIQQSVVQALAYKNEDATFRAEMRSTIADLNKILTDIRVQSSRGNAR